MKICEFETTEDGGIVQFSANIVWEDTDLPTQRLRISSSAFRSDQSFPAAFFLLTMLPGALWEGEERVQIDGSTDSRLVENVRVALSSLSVWFCDSREIPRIETMGPACVARPDGTGCGMSLSGGVDSLCLLLDNRRNLPRTHPRSITHAFFVDGMDINIPGQEDQGSFFARAVDSLHGVCRDQGAELVVVRTNLRDAIFARAGWGSVHHGMAVAAVLQSFPHLIRNGLIAGCLHAMDVRPHGSHPLIEPWCSGYAVKMYHELSHLGRVDRTRIVADDPVALSCLRVCWANITNDGPLNCGYCHKCVLTMLALIACNKLSECSAFPHGDLTAASVKKALRRPSSIALFRELLAPLRLAGRGDLAKPVAELVRDLELKTGVRVGIMTRIAYRIRRRLAC